MGNRSDARKLPDGIEWPRYSDDGLVDITDMLEEGMVVGVEMRTEGYCITCLNGSIQKPYGERIRRPHIGADGKALVKGENVWNAATGEACKVVDLWCGYAYVKLENGVNVKLLPSALTHELPVMDAYGAPLEAGQTVWVEQNGDGPYVIEKIGRFSKVVDCHYKDNENDCLRIWADLLTGKRPVFDANDVLIRPGDVVYANADASGDGTAWRVVRIDPKRAHSVHAEREHGRAVRRDLVPAWLTHEPDTWELIEADAKSIDQLVDSEWGGDPKDARNLVRRCKRLAGRGE